MPETTLVKRATEELKKRIKAGSVRCNCGGPSLGTDHSPDCRINLAWDEIVQELRDDDREKRG